MRHALFLLALAIAAVVGWGIAFSMIEHVSTFTGLYWAITTATTVGYGDVTPHASSGHVLAICTMLTAIPALAACFGLATSAHIRRHFRRHADDVEQKPCEHDYELLLSGIRNILLKLEADEEE